MSVRSRRLALAAVIAAIAIAVPTAALASDPGTSSGKPAPSAAATKSVASQPTARKSTVVSGSAAASKAAARQSGALRSVTVPAMVATLATRLGVGHSAAQRAFNQLDALSGQGGVDPDSSAFAAIARDLGVSRAQLAAALNAAKQAAMQSVAGS